MIRFGTHCSLRKGLTGALSEAKATGCEALQIFTRSPRMWKMRFPAADDVAAFKALRKEMGIFPLAVHTPYLPNLATSDQRLYALSKNALYDDLRVAVELDADYLVIHPGSFSLGSDAARGIDAISRAAVDVFGKVAGRTQLLFENTAGGGRRLGSSFEELAAIMAGINAKERLGICFDTAHALGAGYDLSTPAGIDHTLEEFDRLIGLSNMKLIHCNDSMVPLGAHRDRHQHLGKGFIGSEGFGYLIERLGPRVAAGILETPKDNPRADKRNLALLLGWRAKLR